MLVKYKGPDHVRIINSRDLGLTDEDEQLTEWVWNGENRHVVEVDDNVAEILLGMPNFIEAGADEEIAVEELESDDDAESQSGFDQETPIGDQD